MHFCEDIQHLDNNSLRLILYKHKMRENTNAFYEIDIFDAKYLRYHDVIRLYYQFEFLFKDKLEELEFENWYLITLHMDRFYKFEWDCAELTTNSDNEFHRLH